MLILAIETSNPSSDPEGSGGEVALLERDGDGRDIGYHAEKLASTGRHDDDLMPAIDRLMQMTARFRPDIARVAVSIGPGGYTGLRVACTTGMLIAESLGVPCVGVPTALALLAAHPGRSMAAILAVKGDRMYVHCAGQAEGRVVSVDQLPTLGVSCWIADRFLPESARAWALASGVEVVPPVYSAVEVARLGAGLNPQPMVLPLYAREPEAVSRWRATRG